MKFNNIYQIYLENTIFSECFCFKFDVIVYGQNILNIFVEDGRNFPLELTYYEDLIEQSKELE